MFPPSTLESFYTLEDFHRLGSSILSRSFHVEVWEGEKTEKDDLAASDDEEGEEDGAQHPDESPKIVIGKETSGILSNGDAMDVDEAKENHDIENEEDDDGDDDDDDMEDTSDVSMVPMADMLNARYGCNNVGSARSLFSFPSFINIVSPSSLTFLNIGTPILRRNFGFDDDHKAH